MKTPRSLAQTGHSDFSESTEQVKALTPEEKAAKLAMLKDRIAARRAARGEEEKVDHVKVSRGGLGGWTVRGGRGIR